MKKLISLLAIFLLTFIFIRMKCNDNDINKPVNKGTISGKVTDSNGDPLRGATVTTRPNTDTKVTGASGDYTISDILVGDYTVYSEKENYLPNSIDVVVRPGKTTSADIQLYKRETEKGSIIGKVLDENSNPIDGVLISTEPETHTDHTNSYGEYRLYNITPGTYVVKAFKTGYKESSVTVVVEANIIITADLTLLKVL